MGALLSTVVLGGCGGAGALLGLVGLGGTAIVGLLAGAAVLSDDIEVTPSNPIVPIGARIPFRVEAFSKLGNKIPVDEYRWEINNPAPSVPGTVVGTIDRDSGLFQATGEGTCTVESTVIGIDGLQEGTTLVRVDNSFAPAITTMAVYPSRLALPVGQSLQFLNLATGADGLPVDVNVVWTVQPDNRQAVAGVVNAQTGVFTALVEGTIKVQAQAGDTLSTADVTVAAAPASVGELAAIVVNPPSLIVGPNKAQQFVAYGLDPDGNFLTLDNPAWSVEGGVGTVGANGILTSGATAATGAVVVTIGERLGRTQVQVQTG